MEDPLPSERYLHGTCLLVDKPQGWTSFDVVNKIRSSLRHYFQIKKIKVGHSGTLDPMATGLLIICTGKKTKLLSEYQGLPKVYSGEITLGAITASYDGETEPECPMPVDRLSSEQILETSRKFIGEQWQMPPIYSAIKVDGQPLYKFARAGKEVEITPRKITIYSFEITGIALPRIRFTVHCSKGTYIRSLAHDFGAALGVGGYLSELRREAIGDFHIRDAVSLEDLIVKISSAASIPQS